MSQGWNKRRIVFATTSSNIIIKLDSQEGEIKRLVFMTDSRKERLTASC